jgi:mono/diheme cytochrome c family protein
MEHKGHSRFVAVAALTLGLVGCAATGIEWQNRQPAQDMARQAAPAGSLYAGWRVYEQRCASCHGTDAMGGNGAPDLTFRLRDIGAPRFVDLVLRRYDWGLPPGQSGSPRETLVDEIVARERGALQMPEWGGEPVVSAHIMDLYAYLSARAQGTVPPGRPAR